MHPLQKLPPLCAVVLCFSLFTSKTHAGSAGESEATGGNDSWAGSPVTVGVDISIDGAVGLSGGTESHGRSANASALTHIDWAQAVNADHPVRLAVHASLLALSGRGPSERWLGDFLAASNIAGEPGARVFSWWLEAARDRWSLRSGALVADEEFTGTVVDGSFLNSSFGWPAFISANTLNTGPAYFLAAPGLRLQCDIGDSGAWRIGVYDGDSFDSPSGDPSVNHHGLHYRLGGGQGWFAITEVALGRGAMRIKAGGWLHTSAFADMSDPLREHRGNFGAYAIIERTLAGTTGEAGNMEYYLRLGASPRDRNPIAWAFESGLAWTGLLPGRPVDVAALGLTHAAFGRPYVLSAVATDPTGGQPDYEQVIEASYAYSWTDRITMQPDFQFIRHLGGRAGRGDALIFILRLKVAY
jgi:porin